jgi:hypothetical protein
MRKISAWSLLVLMLAAGPAIAQDVTVELTGGEVSGSVRGQGTASVVARVTNFGAREVHGLRIAVYYSASDVLPSDPESADWRIHEFVFEPPLKPDDSTSLRFSDDNAAEYVLIEVRYVSAGLGLSYNGRDARLKAGLLERDGLTYVATRDLVDLIGGGLSYDGETYEIVIVRQGIELRLKEGSSRVRVDGEAATIEHQVLSEDGTSFLPVADVCPLLGLSVEHDAALNMIKLGD